MKGIVIFDTSHGNTQAVATTISKTLYESGIEVDTLYVKDVKKLNGKDYDFLIIGSPTRLGTMSFAMKGLLGKVKSDEWMDKFFAVFDTELRENIEKKEGCAADKIADRLREKQMKELLPVLRTVVLGMKGPLQEGEIERIKEYTGKLAAELKR